MYTTYIYIVKSKGKYLNAYQRFRINKKQEVQSKNPTFNGRQQLTELARLWAELPEEEKAVSFS